MDGWEAFRYRHRGCKEERDDLFGPQELYFLDGGNPCDGFALVLVLGFGEDCMNCRHRAMELTRHDVGLSLHHPGVLGLHVLIHLDSAQYSLFLFGPGCGLGLEVGIFGLAGGGLD